MEANQESIGKLCVALDTSCLRDALQLAEALKDVAGYFKVGLELYSAAGPAAVESLVGDGHNVILDLKLHDIPNTVARAVKQVSSLGASFLTVHASGGSEMIHAAREAAESAQSDPSKRLGLLAVTVLTSITQHSLLKELGVEKRLKDAVLSLALLAKDAGADGVVASAREVRHLKKACGKEFLAATPGIRPLENQKNDQKRTATPAYAASAGSDILIIGRPITEASDPRAAAIKILKEIGAAMERKKR